MGMEEDWSSETNWTVGYGSLRHCITFQSSLSDEATTSPSQSTPLLLHPPSPDSPPCQINIHFSQKHELRQVYVRSSARVYEIYCAPDLRSTNDYLCTVRCGVAVRDGEVLRSSPIQDLSDDSVKNEDDWVEVKVVDTPNNPLQTKPYINSTKIVQDLHEATAEINDANPCISVTIRLLSLQNKGCVSVDEIYVFADPVDSADSESQESRNDNSSANSLMAMFLPTLMQFSKTTGLGHLNALTKEKQHVSEDDLQATRSIDSVIKTQLKGNASITDPQEVKLNEVKEGWVGPFQLDTLSQVAKTESNRAGLPSQTAKMDSTCGVVPTRIVEMENNHSAVPVQTAKTECNHSAVTSQVTITESNHGDSLGGNVERALEQLVSRMDRIEEICLGFQEKMVMPMNSIEARLQRVEQQLDTVSKKLQNSALPSCCRISAPDTACIESDVNSCENSLHFTINGESEPDKKMHTEVPYVSPHDMSNSANATQLLPGLVVTAPEFPDGEDEEGNALGQEMNSSKDKEKQSIDDALSSALFNFLSSSLSLESPKYTTSLAVKAPEFSNEDDDDCGSSNEIAKNDSVHVTDSEKFSHFQVLDSSNISLGSGEKVKMDSNDKYSEKTAQEAEEYDQFYGAEEHQDEMCVKASTLAEHNPRSGFNDDIEEDKDGKINGQNCDSSSNTSDISNELVDSQTPGGYSITQEGPSARTELTVATELLKNPFHENIIENVLGFSLAPSVVDFDAPLLDVKFISQRSPVSQRFLEDLLVETQETSSGDPSVMDRDDDLSVKEQLKNNGDVSVEEQTNLISIEDGELLNPGSNSHFTMDQDLCSSITEHVNMEGDNLLLPEDHKRKRDQISSLI
ncbi:uncharacterized protein LOC113865351 isoform X2 [Abrus precatorius]|uniref:Uncharacterized protein LOC113865351 isoform X2 n=1 Tax=Abrus precatorius TaxID=3816 RepID=A0A8B8LHB4_ABRPR|nr:uncharacterized protein LOC113865351 isoform X2 [Abrus precatorius]